MLSKLENRYLLRQLCLVMTIEGLETYILVPRDPADISLLVEAMRPTPQPVGPGRRHRQEGPHRSADRCAMA